MRVDGSPPVGHAITTPEWGDTFRALSTSGHRTRGIDLNGLKNWFCDPDYQNQKGYRAFHGRNVMVQWGSAVSTKNVAVTGSFPSPTAVGHLAQQKQKRLFSVHRFGLAIPTWMRNDFGGFAALLYMCSYYHSQDASGAPTTPVGRTVRLRVSAPWNEYRGGVPVTRGIITGPGDGQAHDSTVSSRFIHGSGF